MKIQSTREVSVSHVKTLVYGGAGVGKTRLLATAPKPIIISSEEGLLSLADSDTPFIEVKTLEEFEKAFNMVKNDKQFETIGIDSLTDLAERLIQKIRETETNTMRAYGKLADAIIPMVRKVCQAEKHIVFLAKERKIEDTESESVYFEAYLPGKVSPFTLPYLMDEVFSMQMTRRGPILQTSATRKYPAKDRSGKLEAEEQPNLAEVFRKILNKGE